MPEKLPDLRLYIKGVELQPERREQSEIRRETSEIGDRVLESERRKKEPVLSTRLCCQL